MKNRILGLVLCLLLTIGLLPVSVFAATTIDIADIGITHPAHSESPETFLQVYGNCQVDTTYDSSGHKDGLRWKDISSGQYMDGDDTFVGGQKYELSVMLIAKTGYAFSASATTVTVNGAPVSLTVLDVSRAKATITLTADKLYINYVTITELDDPKAGNTPDFSVKLQENTCKLYSNAQSFVYNGVAWQDKTEGKYLTSEDEFQAGHAYAASICVQPKPGYEFPKNTQATVNGKACTVQVQNGELLQAGTEYPALASSHTHTPSPWRITGAYHYKVCTACGDFLEQEDHKGGTATCKDRGICSVCGEAYLEVTENHTPDTSKWIAREGMYHYHACKLCGAHCDIGEHTAGPAGTPNAAVVCKDCGYILTPAKDHQHNLTKVAKKMLPVRNRAMWSITAATAVRTASPIVQAKTRRRIRLLLRWGIKHPITGERTIPSIGGYAPFVKPSWKKQSLPMI